MQYGFLFDQGRCSGCRACAVACKSWNGLEAGPLKFLKVYEYEKGSFPDVRLHIQWVPCYHCEAPVCLDSCPTEAIYKEPRFGAVLIDQQKCDGCRLCYDACPYGAPVFESDDPVVKAQKCTMCFDRLEKGEKPICVLTCQTRALDFGPIGTLRDKYGERRDLEDLPDSRKTRPAVVFKPQRAKRQLVPYDAGKAIAAMMRREPLPPLFASPADVLRIPEGTVGRNRLVLKHKSAAEFMHRTRNDEG